MAGKNWIKGAIKRPGAFTKKAKKAGMSTGAYAKKVTKKGSTASTRTKRQVQEAEVIDDEGPGERNPCCTLLRVDDQRNRHREEHEQ